VDCLKLLEKESKIESRLDKLATKDKNCKPNSAELLLHIFSLYGLDESRRKMLKKSFAIKPFRLFFIAYFATWSTQSANAKSPNIAIILIVICL
jgi:hypothetical protein